MRARSATPGLRPERRSYVPTRWVVTGALVAVAVLASIIGVAELLRHPGPAGRPPQPESEAADPRVNLDCPELEPREGRDRSGSVLGPDAPPVEASSAILRECPETFDEATVVYEGEAVGGLLDREGGTWTQLNDDAYAGATGPLPTHRTFRGANSGIGVFLPDELAVDVRTVGGRATRGDVLAVEGTFHRIGRSSGEVAVIEARSVEVVRRGESIEDPVLWDRRVAAAILGVLAATVAVVQQWVSRRR